MPRSMWGFGAFCLVSVLCAMSFGRGGDPIDALVLVLPQVPMWAWPALAYLAAGAGYGVLLRPLYRGSRDEVALGIGLGVAAVSAVSLVAGSLGLLSTLAGAIATLAPGWTALGVLLWRRRSHRLRLAAPSLMTWLAAPAAAVLCAGACAPPGWLWDSEFAGFDALSYHLQLPQEWLARGRIEPLTHNVYSFLPGAYEAGVYHIACLTGAPADVGDVPDDSSSSEHADGAFGLLAGDGWRLISAQFLHAMLTLASAWLVGRAAAALVADHGAMAAGGQRAGRIARAMVLASPWCVVVGSLAYNEMPVLGLGAAALLSATDRSLAPWRRGLLAGALVGAACGFKPTAMTFLTPGVGIALLATSPPRQWATLVAAGAVAGVLMLAPWAVRNWLACGNPVFPFASGLFGPGHWSSEQIARYARGHSFDGTFLERLRLLVTMDPNAGPGARDVERWRGLLNPQYGVLFPAALGSVIALLIAPRVDAGVRRVGAILGVMLACQAVAWLFTTHLQSRFLLPSVVPGAMLVALATVGLGGWGGARGMRSWIAPMLVIAQTGYLIATFASQRRGGPSEFTSVGPGAFTGQYEIDPLASAASAINRAMRRGDRVYLLGDSAPLYLTALGPERLLWHTAWDASPLGEAVRAWRSAAGRGGATPAATVGDGPAAWTTSLRRRGVTHVLVNLSELRRYAQSGWYDPDVTADRVGAWLASLGRPVAAWDLTGQALFALPEVPLPTPPATNADPGSEPVERGVR